MAEFGSRYVHLRSFINILKKQLLLFSRDLQPPNKTSREYCARVGGQLGFLQKAMWAVGVSVLPDLRGRGLCKSAYRGLLGHRGGQGRVGEGAATLGSLQNHLPANLEPPIPCCVFPGAYRWARGRGARLWHSPALLTQPCKAPPPRPPTSVCPVCPSLPLGTT